MNVLHHNATADQRDFGRAYVWTLWLGVLAIDALPRLAALPSEAMLPVGGLRWLPAGANEWLLSSAGLWLVQATAIVAVLGSLLRKRVVGFAVAACMLLTLHQSIVRGFGHVNHAELMLLYAAYVFTYFDWAQRSSTEESARPLSVGAPLTAIAFVICATYVLTGVHRLAAGGIEVFTSESMVAWRRNAEISSRWFHFDCGGLFASPWMEQMLAWGFPVVTLLEILAPLLLVSRRFRWVFLALMIPFHVGVFLSMGILFWHTLALYVFLIDARWWPMGTRSKDASAEAPAMA